MLLAIALAGCTASGQLGETGATKPTDGSVDTDVTTDTDTDTDVGTDTPPVDTGPEPPAPETFTEAADRYAALFDPTVLHVVTVDLAPLDWDQLQVDGSSWLPATVTIDGEALPTLGVILTGDQKTFGWDGKVDLRFDFDRVWDGVTWGGMEHLAFDDQAADPAACREALASRALIAAGIPSPRAVLATVQVQGGAPGLYTMREEVEDAFLARWFPPGAGDSWEASDGADFTLAGLPLWEGGGDPAALQAVQVAVQSPARDFDAQVDAVLQLDQLRRVWAWEALIANSDGWPYDLDDVWIYADPLLGGRLAFVPEHPDEAFDPLLPWDGVVADVAVRCRFDAACEAAEIAELRAAADTWDSLGVAGWAQEAFDLTEAAVKADTSRGTPNSAVFNARDALKAVVTARSGAIRGALPPE